MAETHPDTGVESDGLSVNEAAKHIETLLGDDGATDTIDDEKSEPTDDAPQEEVASEADVETDETASEETEEASEEEPDAETETEDEAAEEDEQAEEPAITPPASMNDAEKAEFAKLPPVQQQWLAEREHAMTADYQRKTQEIADSRKKAQEGSEALAQDRRQFQMAQQVLARHIHEVLGGVDERQLAELRNTDPTAWASAIDARQRAQGRLQEINQSLMQSKQAEEQAKQQEFARRMAEGQARLPELIPEWTNPQVKAAEGRQLSEFLTGQAGFSQEEVAGNTDPRLIAMARDAMRYRQLQAKKPEVAKKVAKAPKAVTKPNAAKTQKNQGQQEFERRRGRFQKSGSTRDLGRLIELTLD